MHEHVSHRWSRRRLNASYFKSERASKQASERGLKMQRKSPPHLARRRRRYCGQRRLRWHGRRVGEPCGGVRGRPAGDSEGSARGRAGAVRPAAHASDAPAHLPEKYTSREVYVTGAVATRNGERRQIAGPVMEVGSTKSWWLRRGRSLSLSLPLFQACSHAC